MKFLCSNCKAKYQIADEKVAGRTLRMTCRRCQQEIVIHGEPEAAPSPRGYPMAGGPPVRLPPPPPPPSPLGADFQLQVAANTRPPAPASALDAWHVGINDVPVGPMRREEIARKLASGSVTLDSLAWREGLDDWLPIGRIAELAVLAAPPGAPAALSPPPVLMHPSQRSDLLPLGGRAGAAPSYAVEEWAPVIESQPAHSHSQVTQNPLLTAERRPSGPVMFALAGGFAFLMSALAIMGAQWLVREQRAGATPVPVVAPTAAQPVPTVAPTRQVVAEPEQAPGMVIALDDPALRNQAPSPGRARAAAPSAQAKPGSKKELTDAQKAMLARMGGDTSSSVPNLQTPSSTGSAPAARNSGGLTAEQLSKVVLKGRENLQRCYETALRGSGSDQTVRLDVNISVSPAGNVTSVKTSGQGLPGMSQCIERTVRMWRFPLSGEATDTKFPVVFQPGS
jgi:predicted Zn finger-like uncharacterized protein